MKIIIIPDIHGRKFWRSVDIHDADKVIFLGDYLDPYFNEFTHPELMDCEYFGDSESLLKMLQDIINIKKESPENVILLLGNHDWQYLGGTKSNRIDCKNEEIYHNIFKENLSLFNLAWTEKSYIFSHAGIVNSWREETDLLECAKYLQNVDLSAVVNDYSSELRKRLNIISFYRGGWQNYGSPLWADINEHLNWDEPLEYDYYQIFGHTHIKKPVITKSWACLDCDRAFILDTETNKIVEYE